MLHLKTRYEHSVEQRNLTGVQLIDRNDELCILYERSNQQQEALKRGEMVNLMSSILNQFYKLDAQESLRKEEELRLVRLQTEELKRQFLAAKKRLPQLESDQHRVEQLEKVTYYKVYNLVHNIFSTKELTAERKRTEELSAKLEDPGNASRWRSLQGEDPDLEQLSAKIQVGEISTWLSS